MKLLLFFVSFILLVNNPTKGQNNTNILNGTALLYILPFSIDTIKDPSGSKLTRKQKRRQGKAVQRTDFTLSKEKKVADKLYEALGYMAAAEKYESLEGLERNRFVLAKLANSYRLNGQTEDAEYCYSKIVNDSDNPEELLHYAQVLQSNGKCEDAVRWYRKYLEVAFDAKREFILDCETLSDFKESDIYLDNLQTINTEYLDFSPIPYQDGFMFTSNRGGASQLMKRRDTWTKNSFSDLYFAKKGKEGDVIEVEELGGEINGKYHDGVPTFNSAGTTMIFTRNNKKGKDSSGNRLLKLYEATRENGYWINVQELPLNSDEFSNCHPTLSKDGRRLYFSSDREDGFGGMDLYVSENIGGIWREATNLGPIVNSEGNEVFPFIGEDDQLFYSSDGHLGLGGLDIFSIKKTNPNDEKSWSIRENIGRPFNSSKDDFGFIMNKDGESGYITSNRIGGKGGDDIYAWKGSLVKKTKKNSLERSICVYDPETGNKIKGVSVTVLETSDNQLNGNSNSRELYLTLKPLDSRNQEYVLSIIEKNNNSLSQSNNYITDQKGTFDYIPVPQNNYIFVLEKTGFHTSRQTVSATEILDKEEYCFTLEKRTCLSLNGIVKNTDYSSLIPDAEVKLFNKCTGQVEATFSDKKGAFDFCLDCGCEYEIYAAKPNFEGNKTLISTFNNDCEQLELQKPLVATIDMKIVDNPDLSLSDSEISKPAPYSTPFWNYPENGQTKGQPNIVYVPVAGNYYNPDGIIPTRPQDLNGYFLGDSSKEFKEGQLIKLSNIYYDFDKYVIRRDASRELDHVYNLLRAYPTMEIALMAHTDSRGSERYNNWLSRKRAKAAVQYLLDRGIEPRRLLNIGLGESRIVNDCGNNIKCLETEHQKNRRTEIRILKLNEPGVRVEYED